MLILISIPGYGRIVPYSDTGKSVTMAVTLPIIALYMALYVYTGEIVTSFTRITVVSIRRRLLRDFTRKHLALQTLILQLILTILLWLMLAALDWAVYKDQGRRYFDSMYFVMMTISTVGFGDFSYSCLDNFNAGFYYLLLSAFCFLFSMGTFTSSISQLNQVIIDFSKHKPKAFVKRMTTKRITNGNAKKTEKGSLSYTNHNTEKVNLSYINHIF